MALLIALTLHDIHVNKKTSTTSQYKMMPEQTACTMTVNDGKLFKIAGMWIDKDIRLKR